MLLVILVLIALGYIVYILTRWHTTKLIAMNRYDYITRELDDINIDQEGRIWKDWLMKDKNVFDAGCEVNKRLMTWLKFLAEERTISKQDLIESAVKNACLESKLVELRRKYRAAQGQIVDGIQSKWQFKAFHEHEIERILATMDSAKIQHAENTVRLVEEKHCTEKSLVEVEQACASLVAIEKKKSQLLETDLLKVRKKLNSSDEKVVKLETRIANVFKKQIAKLKETNKTLEASVKNLKKYSANDPQRHDFLVRAQRAKIRNLGKSKP
ncbi:hypothetical protein HDE_06495 [Halotydeus destructor]|nr:hypothetical protein HDE_06495 [Halotydeus destructor]